MTLQTARRGECSSETHGRFSARPNAVTLAIGMPGSPSSPVRQLETPPVSPERRVKVDAARQAWIRQLVDMSRRNNLLYFRDLKIGTLEFKNAPAEAMQELLQSGKTERGIPFNDLVPADARTQATASLAEVAARARSNFEEKGLETLFLALGLASWTAADGGRDSAAPVLLVPVQATQTSGRNGAWSLKRSGDVKVNDVLIHALREEHGVSVDGEALLAQVLGDDDGEVFDLAPAFETLSRSCARPWIRHRAALVLGNFAFQKMAIVKDLQRQGEALAEHDLVAGIAGDAGARTVARG